MDCLFCKIANRSLKSNILFEDEKVVVFDDINPQSPQHKLIIPKQHIATVNDLNEENVELIGHMVLTGKAMAKKLGLADDGYRLVFNCNKGGGQEVYHIHLHLLGGRQMHWPPG